MNAPPASALPLDRTGWLARLWRVARPPLEALAQRRLRATLPVETAGAATPAERAPFTHLEAVGRTLAGLAPWLEAPGLASAEAAEQARWRECVHEGLAALVDPRSPDCGNFTEGSQPLVDAAFLAQAVLRAPRVLGENLPAVVRERLVAALRATRCIRPAFNNWLLFAAEIEAALHRLGAADWDRMRIDYALRQHEQWYCGDGAYGDGPRFHWDYYNSFVIHPMLLDTLDTVGAHERWEATFGAAVRARAARYAAVLARLVAPDGSFPPLGRSLAYRGGALHLLAQLAWQERLPEGLAPAAARRVLGAAIARTLDAPGTFDEAGWLRIGLAGAQPRLGERYISTGSLYLCSVAFLPLGLPPPAPFWTAAAAATPWEAAWSGQDLPPDRALPD